MELYIGGFAQGKTAYVKNRYSGRDVALYDDIHLWVRSNLEQGKDPVEETDRLLQQIREQEKQGSLAVIIGNEVGNGIVPADPFEIQYRETVGRTLIRMAAEATHVERIVCGMGQRLK